jgi:hypothetical protein
MSASARGKISIFTDGGSASRAPSHLIGLRSQAIPESSIRLDRLAGMEALDKKFFQFLLGSLKAGSGSNLHSGNGGVKRLFSGTIRAGVDDCPDSLFLFGSELYGHRRCFRHGGIQRSANSLRLAHSLFPRVHPGRKYFRIFQPYQHPLRHLLLLRLLLRRGIRIGGEKLRPVLRRDHLPPAVP